MLPLCGRLDAETLQNGIADVIPGGERFAAPVAECAEVQIDVELSDLLRCAFVVKGDLHFRFPVDPEAVAVEGKMDEAVGGGCLQGESVFSGNGRCFHESGGIGRHIGSEDPADPDGPSGNRLPRIAEIHRTADVHRCGNSRKREEKGGEEGSKIHPAEILCCMVVSR